MNWILTADRLPEEDVDVLVVWRDTVYWNTGYAITSYGNLRLGGERLEGYGKNWQPPFEGFHGRYEVVAWMPIPEWED